jgi:signal transduction histidine kinase
MGVYILPSLYYLKPYYFPAFIAALYVSIIIFSDSFLQLRTRHPQLHRASLVFLVIWGGVFIMIPFINYPQLSQIVAPIQLVTIAFIWVVGLYTWRKGFKPMGFFMLAWLGMAASLFLLMLVRVGSIPSTYLTENLFLFGCIFMAVSWSIALANRINLLKLETDQANRDFRHSERKLSQILESFPLGVVVYGKDHKPSYMNKRTAEIISNPEKDLVPNVEAGRTLEQALEHFSFKLAGTDQKYPVNSFPVSQALNGEAVFVDDIEIADGNRSVPLEVWANPVRDEHGEVEAAVAAFQDISLRKQADIELDQYRKNLEQLVNERTAELSAINEQLDYEVQERKSLEQSLLQRIEWISKINEIHQSITGVDNLATAYEQLSGTILNLLDAQAVLIVGWDEQDRQFQMQSRTSEGVVQARPEVIQKIFKSGSPLRRDLEKGKLILLSPEQVGSLPSPIEEYVQVGEKQSLVLSPLLAGQLLNGMLGIVVTISEMDMSAYQYALIERISYDLAHLIDDAIMLDQRRALATMDERNRLARELHDSVAQALYGISLFTDATRLALESNRLEIVRQHLDDLSQLSREAISDMRMLIFELRPPILDKEGLAAALQSRLDAVESRAGVKAVLNVKGVLDLSQEQESELYRIAQEALNNVVKHAHARHVRVELTSRTESVRLLIEDDGIGFDPATAEQCGGQGFRNIRERAEIIGAKCSIISESGRGTQIVIEVNP